MIRAEVEFDNSLEASRMKNLTILEGLLSLIVQVNNNLEREKARKGILKLNRQHIVFV